MGLDCKVCTKYVMIESGIVSNEMIAVLITKLYSINFRDHDDRHF